MAQYAVLIYEEETSRANAGQEGFEQALREHAAFGENKRLGPARRQCAAAN